MRTSIKIAGKVFFLDTDAAAIGRRKRFFEELEKDNTVLSRLPGMSDEPDKEKPVVAKATEGKPVETKAAEGKSVETKAAEGKSVETKAAEGKPAEEDPVEAKAAEGKPAEEDPVEENSAMEENDTNDTESKDATLTIDEINILKALGIYGNGLKSLAPYMSTFFESLPNCSSDTNLMLKKECDTAFYVLWSVLFAAQQRAEKALQENKNTHDYLSDIDMAQTGAIVTSIDTLFPEKRTFSSKDIMKIFTISGDPGGEAFMELLTLAVHVSEKKPLTSRQSQILEIFRLVPLTSLGKGQTF
jgi:uncharacterized low-complexity protein